jgi:S-adenosyl-L-methionine hydrolase (adenosine-forming)
MGLGQLGEPVKGSLVDLPVQDSAIVWVDRFGNLITNLKPPVTALQVNGHDVRMRARTFGEGPPFVYLGSMGLVSIGVAKGRADEALGAGVGTPLKVLT